MKKKISVLLAVLMVCSLGLFTGCGETTSISMYDLQKAMLGVDSSLESLATVNKSGDEDGELFEYISDISYDKVDNYFLAYAQQAAEDTSEIAVIALKDKSDVTECKESLQEHLNGRKQMYQAYRPEQVPSLENALLFEKDNLVVLIVHEKQDKIKDAFDEFMKNN